MLTSIIYVFICVTFLIAIYATNRTGEKANGNILLGVTLPDSALKDNAVTYIVKKYHKAYSIVAFIFLLLILSFIFLRNYVSISTVYFMLWCISFLYTDRIVVNKYFNELYSLKREKEWWVGAHHIINIDTEVSRLKNTFPISKMWFFIPLIISLIPVTIHLFYKNLNMYHWAISLCGIIPFIFSFLMYLVYTRDRTKTYSQNTEINLALNRIYKREWSKCWVIIAIMESVLFIIIPLILFNKISDSVFFLIFICISRPFVILPIIKAYNKVRAEKNIFLQLDNKAIYADHDQYWEKGYYYNSNDNRTLVEKRFGYGMTVNIAKVGGKVVTIAIMFAISLVIISVMRIAILLSPLDFNSVLLTVSEETVTIQAPLSEYSFLTSDIRNVAFIDDFPRANKINGGNSETFFVGKFNVTGYGASNVYIHRKCPPFIVVELDNGWVFLNGNTKEQTEKYFNDLENAGALIGSNADGNGSYTQN